MTSSDHGTPSGIPSGPIRAFVVERQGDGLSAGVRELHAADLPDQPVTVRVEWSSVNYKDGMVATPGNRVARTSPLVPGVDLVGTVVDVAGGGGGGGGGTAPVAVGDDVVVHGYGLGISQHGAFAQFARVPAAWVVPLPRGLSARRAALIGTAGFTAALSLARLERMGLAPGSGPVLVTGASGGVGSLSVALLAARGYEVVASTGKAAEREYLVGLGARDVIGRDDLQEASDRVLGTERWAGAVDCVGGATLRGVLRSLRYGAAVAASGLTGGASFDTTVYPFIVRGVSLLGIDSVETPIDERRSVWHELATAFPPETLDATVAGEIGLDGLSDALATISRGEVRGRILVRPWS